MNAKTERYFAPCPRGLEPSLAAELSAGGALDIEPCEGGAAFAGDLSLAYRANLESRIASRILWRVGAGRYRNEKDLAALARSITWSRHFDVRRTLRVDIAATRSPLASLDYATLTVKDALCDRFRDDTGARPSIDKRSPDVRVHVHLSASEASIYLDTSGEPLFKRGWRKVADEAPLRENLAAGLLKLAGWTPAQPLLDPMCGSGTIAVEAALIAADRAPGLARTFGFQKLAWYDGPTWQRIRQAAHDRVRPALSLPMIFASDRSPGALAKTRGNLVAAKMENFVSVEQADVLERTAPMASGLLLTNPPYGVRLDDQQRLAAFYPKLGDALKRHFPGWIAWILSGDPQLAKLIGLAVRRRIPLWNGALECRLFAIPLVAGRMPGRGREDGHPMLELRS